MAINQFKPRARVVVTDAKTGKIVADQMDCSSYIQSIGAYCRMPVPVKEGKTAKYIVTVERLEDLQYAKPYAKRLAAQQRSEERSKKRAAEQEAKALILRRARIMNQIELAFAKNGKDAVKFVTCDECHDLASVLTLTHENPGSTIISPEQISGARCADHAPWQHAKVPAVLCDTLEFFYDGVKQIYVNKQVAAK